MKPKRLTVEGRLARPDDFYASLLELHRGLSAEESRLANAKLILLLANHIGDHQVLDEALRIAREGLGERASSGGRPESGMTEPSPSPLVAATTRQSS
mgnify:CR=1 FL=1